MQVYIKENFRQVKEIMLFLILSIWIMMPVFKNLKVTWMQATIQEYRYIFFVGIVGVILLIFNIYKNSIKSKDRKKYDKEMLPITILGIYMLWTLISCLFSDNKMSAFLGTDYRKDGYVTYIGYAGFFSCAYLVKSEKLKNILANMLVVVAILNIAMVELCTNPIFSNLFVTRDIDTTVFYQFNHFGYYLLISTVTAFFLCITQKKKIIKIVYLLSFVFLMYYLVLNNTFGCFIALAITLLFFFIYCIYYKKINRYMLLAIIIIILSLFIVPQVRKVIGNNINGFINDINKIFEAGQLIGRGENEYAINNALKAGTGRLELWVNGIKFFLENPVFGYGPENLRDLYWKVGIIQDRPHNLLIQLATTSGIVGLLTYISAIAIIWIRGLKRMRFDNKIYIISFFVVTAYLISAMFGNSMYYTSPYFFIFLGLLMSENFKNLNNSK